jgi:Domain of unknown function (DUF5069)
VEPLDLTHRPPRSCYAELDGLMVMPRTIDKLRAFLPGGSPGDYFIDGPIKGLSRFLFELLRIDDRELLEAVAIAKSEDEVAVWIRAHTDAERYPEINALLRRIKPKHAEDPAVFARLYAETITHHPELETIIDIVDADDRRLFPNYSGSTGI